MRNMEYLLLGLVFLLFVFNIIFSLYLFQQNKELNGKMEQQSTEIGERLSNLKENFDDFKEEKNLVPGIKDNKLFEKDIFNRDFFENDLFNEDFFGSRNNIFNLEKRMNDQMNQFFGSGNRNGFSINLNPQGGNSMRFSQKTIENGNVFEYLIDVDDLDVNGYVISSDKDKINKLKADLESEGLSIKVEKDKLSFYGKIENINNLLELFNIRSNFERKNDNGNAF